MSTETTLKRTCPKCGKMLKIPSKYLGLKVECIHCKAHFVVKPPQAGGGVQLADEEEEKIPIDDELADLKRGAPAEQSQPEPAPSTTVGTGSSSMISTVTGPEQAAEQQDKATNGYMVAKVHMGGRMAHANLEDTLNKYAAEGWQFVYAVHHGTDLYVIFRRA